MTNEAGGDYPDDNLVFGDGDSLSARGVQKALAEGEQRSGRETEGSLCCLCSRALPKSHQVGS
jgi:hypothetical protein